MTILIAALLVLAPNHLDLPPEGVYVAAEPTSPAVRLDPPDPPATEQVPASASYSDASSDGRCVGAEPLLRQYSPGWDVVRMSRIMYRESRCQAQVRNRSSSATGLLQILSSHCGWLSDQMDTWCTRDRLTDPYFNVRAGATLWREQGYRAWSTS